MGTTESSHANQPRRHHADPPGWSRVGRPGPRRLVCLLTTLHPERALSNALVQHLSEEMRDMEFTLESAYPDVIWVCGFEPGAEDLVADLRARHPDSFLVVTGRGAVETWGEAVEGAGADYCCGWPLPVEELRRTLLPRRVR